MGDSQLVKGTTIVAVAGIAFDLWVSLFMVDRNIPLHVIRVLTAMFAVILLYGLYLIYKGWQADKYNQT